MGDTIEKVSIVISQGSLEGIYPGLIMANGARAEGIEANLFFTFFGLDAIHKKRIDHMKVASVGNPGLHMATIVGALPGMSAIATHMMEKKMDELDIPPLHEFLEMIGDTGAGMYACKASRRHVRPLEGRLHRAGRGHHHRRRVLRDRRRRRRSSSPDPRTDHVRGLRWRGRGRGAFPRPELDVSTEAEGSAGAGAPRPA